MILIDGRYLRWAALTQSIRCNEKKGRVGGRVKCRPKKSTKKLFEMS